MLGKDGNPVLEAFFRIWQQVRERNDGTLPRKDMIGLTDLRRLAAMSMLHEITPDDDLIIRRSGTQQDAAMERSMTNVSYRSFMSERAFQEVLAFHKVMANTPCGGFAVDQMIRKDGLAMVYKALTLPLAPGRNGNMWTLSITTMRDQKFGRRVPGGLSSIGDRKLVKAWFLDIGHGAPEFSGKR